MAHVTSGLRVSHVTRTITSLAIATALGVLVPATSYAATSTLTVNVAKGGCITLVVDNSNWTSNSYCAPTTNGVEVQDPSATAGTAAVLEVDTSGVSAGYGFTNFSQGETSSEPAISF